MKSQDAVKKLNNEEVAEAFTYMVEAVSDYAIFLLDLHGTVLTWNKAAAIMKGYSAQEIIGQSFSVLYSNADQARNHANHNLERAAQDGTFQEETWRKKKDGSLFWAMVEIIAIKTPDGIHTGYCKLTRDITVRKQLQDQLVAEKERAQVTLGAIGDAVISVDAEGKVDYLNPKAEQMTGSKISEAVGQPLGNVFLAVDEITQLSREHQLVTWLREGHGTAVNSPATLISKGGAHYAVEDTAAPIRLPDGRVTGGVIVFRDVTESRQLLNTVTYQATHDALTGLFNRSEFEHRLERSLARAKKSHVTGAVLFFDLDQFKIVNDSAGHDAGDKLLQQLAHLYRDELRDRDTLARLGGDEFALIADHCSQEEAFIIARKILDSTRNYHFTYGERIFKVGVSIGLVTFNETTGSRQELMQLVDRACYIAKGNGRNQIHCLDFDHSELDSASDTQGTDWLTRLTEAMRLDQLQLHYQPIAAANNRHHGLHFEVLLRLIDPAQGVIMPSRFLPAAERYELMPIIDRWVMQHVMQWLEANRKNTSPLTLCSINLSGKTLCDGTFVSDLEKMLGRHQIAPERLCFEIQEEAAAIEMRKSQAAIKEIRALGCKVCLTGFGLGTGSFAFLKRLEVDFLKIDGTFISAVSESLVDEKMVKLMHEIAHLTGKETIAERVEDQATAEVLSRIGIDYLQGHWIGYPMELNSCMNAPH